MPADGKYLDPEPCHKRSVPPPLRQFFEFRCMWDRNGQDVAVGHLSNSEQLSEGFAQ